MTALQIIVVLASLAALAVILYGLHRLGLWLESRGLLYYKHKQSESSAGGCFVALQQALEPPSRHVYQIEDEKRHHSDEEAPGANDDKPMP